MSVEVVPKVDWRTIDWSGPALSSLDIRGDSRGVVRPTTGGKFALIEVKEQGLDFLARFDTEDEARAENFNLAWNS